LLLFFIVRLGVSRAAVSGTGSDPPMAGALLLAMQSTVTQDANQGYWGRERGNIRFAQIAIRFVQRVLSECCG